MLRSLRSGSRALWVAFALVAPTALPAHAQSTPEAARPHALQGVTWVGESTPRTILIRDGRIERVLAADEEVSGAYTVIDGTGLVATASFLDAYTHAGCETAEPEKDQDRPVDVGANVRTDMRPANRKGIQPSFLAADVLTLEEDTVDDWSRAGFGAMLSAPHGELLAGRSALVATRDAAKRDVLVRGEVFHHASFRASGPGYPSTLMAYLAQLRQFLMDARHQATLLERWEAGRPGPRPPHDPELESALALLDGTARLVCEAETARDVHRWIALADEFGLQIAIAGGRDAWRAADVLAERGIPVVLTLDWGDEVDDPREEDENDDEEGAAEESSDEEAADEPADGAPVEDAAPDWDYETPFGVRLDERLRWEERRDSARVLADAGVRVLFGTGGGSADDLLEHVRALVEAGFPADAALEALTSGAADWLGVPRHFGQIQAGAGAHLTLWTGDPFADDSQVRYAITDGFVEEFDAKADEPPAEGVDLDGVWVARDPDSEDEDELVLTLEMDDEGVVTGTAVLHSEGATNETTIEGRVRGTNVELRGTFAVESIEIVVELDGEWNDDGFAGEAEVSFANQRQVSRFEAARRPDAHRGGQR